jgi:F-type H+-transporting ATPase subunit a
VILGLEFPPISHAIEWPDLFGSGPFAVNKVVILMWLSVAIVGGFFVIAGRRRQLVPGGVQNFAETIVEFVREEIIMQTMGADGLAWTPFLLTIFSFVFVCNIWEIIPGAQMPVNARMAIPALLALLVWVCYHTVGIAKQGPFRYIKSSCVPPGVPIAIIPLVFFIELVGILITRPLSLAVRLFANMLAGHLLLISFAVLSTALFSADVLFIPAVLPGALLVALTAFEILVSVLQAYIFTILTAVYIGGAMHPEH